MHTEAVGHAQSPGRGVEALAIRQTPPFRGAPVSESEGSASRKRGGKMNRRRDGPHSSGSAARFFGGGPFSFRLQQQRS